MYRAPLRRLRPSITALSSAYSLPARRSLFSSRSSETRRGTWKGTALRWGVAGALVYWYFTSPLFEDDASPRTRHAPPAFSESDSQVIDAMVEEKRKQLTARAKAREQEDEIPTPAPVTEESKPSTQGDQAASEAPAPGGPEALAEEADQQGAFNPETGEINWDCPCLGGMAQGPCGEEFKAAFSCFVYSKEEPKGMDCVDKFQHMQDCFRKHPDVYGDELAADEEDDMPAVDEGAAKVGEAKQGDKVAADAGIDRGKEVAREDAGSTVDPAQPKLSQTDKEEDKVAEKESRSSPANTASTLKDRAENAVASSRGEAHR